MHWEALLCSLSFHRCLFLSCWYECLRKPFTSFTPLHFLLLHPNLSLALVPLFRFYIKQLRPETLFFCVGLVLMFSLQWEKMHFTFKGLYVFYIAFGIAAGSKYLLRYASCIFFQHSFHSITSDTSSSRSYTSYSCSFDFLPFLPIANGFFSSRNCTDCAAIDRWGFFFMLIAYP